MTNRRLSDSIITAHAIACEENKKEIALLLIEALELELTRLGGEHRERRNRTEPIEAAFDLHVKIFGPLSPTDARTGL